MHTSKTRNQFTASQWNVVVQPPLGDRSPHVMVTWERNSITLNVLLPPPSYLYMLSMMSDALEYPFSIGVACPGCVSSQPPCIHNFPTSMQVYENQKSNTCRMTARHVGRNSTLCNCLFYTCGSTRARIGIVGAFRVLPYRKAAFLSLHPMTERLKIHLLLLISEIG